ncbi:GDSL esterase/lipase At5g55050-like [Tasmannia lanceolata]|uniref:GDSL esterase/lipase At5g55050-like n=1 Tax=Tasmannia lanceolata TaxID=3420 RepID=UPI0040649E28
MAGQWHPVLVLTLCLSIIALGAAHREVPSIFVFGDSTADVGTNNFLARTKAKANFPFNGIDFPDAIPTGRFSNGLNSADFVALKPIAELLHKGEVIPMAMQIQQFSTVYSNLTYRLGTPGTNRFLSRALFLISVGSNDIFEFFGIPTGPKNATAFLTSVIAKYDDHLTNMYILGARKFGIIAAPPIGFCPSQRSRNATDPLNKMARLYYSSLRTLLQTLSSELPGMKYSLGNAYKMVINFMDDPMAFGFKEIMSACCGSGEFNGENICTTNASLCTNRREYLFWDLFHPTQAASKLAAKTLHSGSTAFVSPINFKQLADDHS